MHHISALRLVIQELCQFTQGGEVRLDLVTQK